MKLIYSLLILTLVTSSLTGCIIHTRGSGRARACPPAYHWDGYACVHNGRGNGNVRDHRR
jgi:hypothetical protein